jgi:threonine aldolase
VNANDALPPLIVDLYSDTQTRPTPAMRRYMCDAEVGDEQRGEDPSVNRLQAMVAGLLGKEAALFLPSGTMCNQISIRLHCQPGDEMLLDATAHPLNAEAGGPAALSGVIVTGLRGHRGTFTAGDVRAAIRPITRYQPRTRLVSVEQTANMAGGTIWPIATIDDVCTAAREHGLATHLDGARLLNAVVATGVSAARHAAGFDSAWIDLSKGLGAPVGAVLAGSATFIEAAWRWKQRLGGAMRQAGIIAAAGIYALEHHVERLADDHRLARMLAEGLAVIPGIRLEPAQVETNIVVFELADARMPREAFLERLRRRGVRMGPALGRTLRAVTHLDVDVEGIERALVAVRSVMIEAESA